MLISEITAHTMVLSFVTIRWYNLMGRENVVIEESVGVRDDPHCFLALCLPLLFKGNTSRFIFFLI